MVAKELVLYQKQYTPNPEDQYKPKGYSSVFRNLVKHA